MCLKLDFQQFGQPHREKLRIRSTQEMDDAHTVLGIDVEPIYDYLWRTMSSRIDCQNQLHKIKDTLFIFDVIICPYLFFL